jgi:lysylphosphatidylglycerol synthetase-like protein (DUF2156 family)
MNWQALFDGILAAVAFGVVVLTAQSKPSLRMACTILGSAAALGTLRFSGLLPLPALHQFVSMLGAGVGLPLLGIAVSQPTSAVATQRRYAWIFAVVAAVICTVLVMVAQLKAWAAVCAVLSALTIVSAGISRRQGKTTAAGLLILLALGAFAAKFQFGALQPGDFLHIGLALGLLLLMRSEPTYSKPSS